MDSTNNPTAADVALAQAQLVSYTLRTGKCYECDSKRLIQDGQHVRCGGRCGLVLYNGQVPVRPAREEDAS
ncbi:MAG TPA: hypothetical protein VGE07_23555 [Herpetosiphonaceae bacterium]